MKVRIPSNKLLPGDIILCLSIAILTVLVFVLMLSRADSAEYVEIRSDHSSDRYSLSENRKIDVESNSHRLTVIIEDGAAFVELSDCPDHVCENTGRISKSGESIICVPAHVTVTVTGKSEVDYALR